MRKILLSLLMFVLFLISFGSDFIDIKELDRGMKGYCITVFEETKTDTFEVEVIDVISEGEASVEMVLVKCFGDKIEKTGIAQGMSGSPVYFNGKLFGSMSYTWDNLKEPIGGVVPIKRMLEIDLFENQNMDVKGYKLKEIAVPVVLTGVDERVLEDLRDDVGVLKYAVSGKNSFAAKNLSGELSPGKSIAIKLIEGDMSASAIGTVTYVSDNRVYSLGHPFNLKGNVEYPVSEAYIYTVLPRNDISYKMGFPLLKSLGCAVQDRTYGILSLSDKSARMVNVSFVMNNGKRISMKFAKENEIIASYLPLMFVSAISNSYKTAGPMTADYKMSVFSNNKKKLEYKNMVTGENLFLGIYFDLQSILYSYFYNMYENINPDSIVIESSVNEEINQYFIWDIRTDKKYYSPGETVEGNVLMKTYKGNNEMQPFSFLIPDNCPLDSMLLYVAGGKSDIMSDAARSEAKYQYKNIKTFEDIVNNVNPSNSIVLKLFGRRRGFVDNNREYFKLPQSFINKQILSGKKSIMSDILYKKILLTNGVIEGEATTILKIRRSQ
ncbi:MAG: SpoIVB peptidase S55 domain-containing protein [bacterium]